MFESEWASLIQVPDLFGFEYPILKARKGSQEVMFYNDGEYSLKEETIFVDGRSNITRVWVLLQQKSFESTLKTRRLLCSIVVEHNADRIDMVFNKKR